MKKLIALNGDVCGTRASKLYELVHIGDSIYVFITYSFDNSLEIKEIREDSYHIGENIFKDVIKNPLQFKYHHYESFVNIWRAGIIENHKWMPDNYYLHILQMREERINQVESIKQGTKRALSLLSEHLESQDYGYMNTQIHLG